MKVKAYQEDLQAALAVVDKFTGSKDIIDHVLIETVGDKLRFTGTNLIQTLKRSIPAVIEEEGRCLFPSSTLLSYIKELPKEIVTMEKDENKVVIRCARHKGNMSVINPDMLPRAQEPTQGIITCQVTAEALSLAINQTIGSAATGNEKPLMASLNLEGDGTTVGVTGVNGLVLSHTDIPGTGIINIVVPTKAMAELSRLISGEKDIMIAYGNNVVSFSFSNTQLLTLVPIGVFPDYRQVIPKPSTKYSKTSIGTQDLKRAIRATMVLAKDSTVVLASSGKFIKVSSLRGEIGDSETEVEAIMEGAIDIALNAEYLDDILDTIGEANTEIRVIDGKSPIVIKGVGDTKLWHIAMPVMRLTAKPEAEEAEAIEEVIEEVEEDLEDLDAAIDMEVKRRR